MGCLLTGLQAGAVRAQAPEPSADVPARPVTAWALFVDGRPADWAPAAPYGVDSLNAAVGQVLAGLQREGFYLAALDSVHVDTTAQPQAVQLYVTRGPAVRVGDVRLEGASVLEAEVLLRQMDTRAGRTLDAAVLEADLEALLARYDEAGLALAEVRVEEIALRAGTDGAPHRLEVVIRVEEGPILRLGQVEVAGAARTRAGYLGRVLGLRPGQSLAGYDPAEVQRRLEETGLFKRVDPPELVVAPDSSVVLRLAFEEEPPGAFDLVLGYLPPSGGGGGGSLVGSGHLVLRNLFGDGRLMALKLNRMPGQVSSADVRLADPYVLGLPLGAEARFAGLQQDSTYGQQRYQVELSYRLQRRLQVFATLSREATRPGQAGVRQVQGRQLVPRADAWFTGVGVRYQRLDRPLNPRRGFVLETNLEQGRKVRLARQDTTTARTLLRQERLQARVRLYLPTFARQVFVSGVEAALLASSAYDESDLFRLGGATSLRGYDEDRFRGRLVGRALAEYRYQLDRSSFAFLFFDLGYVDRPALTGRAETERAFYPGYGIGVQFDTNLGLVNASYAISPEDSPMGGRVHVGLSLGL